MKVTDVLNKTNMTSEHAIVSMRIYFKDAIKQPQFYTHRDYTNLCFKNIQPRIDNGMDLQSTFSETCFHKVSEIISSCLNWIIKELVPVKVIQKRKKKLHYWELKCQQLQDEVSHFNSQFRALKDHDSYQIFKNSRNRMTKLLKREEKNSASN